MSKFSGKCDFYDDIEIHGLDTILNSIIYLGDEEGGKELLDLKNYKDCIPYFGHIIMSAGMDNINHTGTIYLSRLPWIEYKKINNMITDEMYQYYKNELEKEMSKYA